MAELTYHAFLPVYRTVETSNGLQPTKDDYSKAWSHYKATGEVKSFAKKSLTKKSPTKKSPTKKPKKTSTERIKEKLVKPLSPVSASGYNIGAIATPQKTSKRASTKRNVGSLPTSPIRKQSPPKTQSRTPTKSPKAPRSTPNITTVIVEPYIDKILGQESGDTKHKWYHRQYILLDNDAKSITGLKSPKMTVHTKKVVSSRVELFPYQLYTTFGSPKITAGIARWKLIKDNHEYTLETTRNELDAMEHHEERFWTDRTHVHDFDIIGIKDTENDVEHLANLLNNDFGTGKSVTRQY